MKGKVWKFGDNVNTDEIIPARYLNTSDPAELAAHVMEDADPAFVKKMSKGDIIVAGENFGCGSSREHAPIAIKAAGVSCVIAKSFARIFFRNAINIGLAIIPAPDVAEEAHEGQMLEVDLAAGTVKNLETGKVYSFPAFPDQLAGIIAEGGLLKYMKKNVKIRPRTGQLCGTGGHGLRSHSEGGLPASAWMASTAARTGANAPEQIGVRRY